MKFMKYTLLGEDKRRIVESRQLLPRFTTLSEK